MATLSAFTTNTAKNIQLDAGVILKGVTDGEVQALTDASAVDKLISTKGLGATKGGATFSAIPEIRSLLDGINGTRGNYKEGMIIDSWDITLKTTVSELTANNFKLALGMKAEAGTAAGQHKKFTPTVGILKSKHFEDSVAWVGMLAGNAKPIVILIKNVYASNGLTLSAEDKGTGSVELELKGTFSLAHPDDVPFTLYYPNE